jgi:hypothetical protein
MRCRLAAALAISLTVLSGSAFAHHGAAAYDASKTVTIKGTVTEFVFANPHTLIYIEAREEDGRTRKWQGELTSPNTLMRAGWTKSTIKVGDQLTLVGWPSKSGSPSMWILKVLTANGEELKTNWE